MAFYHESRLAARADKEMRIVLAGKTGEGQCLHFTFLSDTRRSLLLFY